MTWSKISDDFSDDCWELSDAAFRLHVEGLIWSNRKLTDLALKKDDMVRWAKRPVAAAELVAIGWWTDIGQYYEIVHHGSYQRTKEAVVKQQAANRNNGKKGGRPRGPAREQAGELKPAGTYSLAHLQSETETERDRTGQDRPGREEGVSQSWPLWKGAGLDPFLEYS